MLKKAKAAVRKVQKGVFPPPAVKSVEEVVHLFKQKGVGSVIAEPSCYQKLFDGSHKLAIDYLGGGGKKPIHRQEVLKVIPNKDVTDDHLVEEMKALYPLIHERVRHLRAELGGVAVTIPEHIVKALTMPSRTVQQA